MTETTDFYLAAYLLSQGYDLEGVDKTNPNRVMFRFDANKEEVVNFFHRQCRVEPIRYSIAIKRLKKVLYEDKDTGTL